MMPPMVLDVHDVRLRRGIRQILDHVSFGVPRGGLVALMGPSGSGKTTVLRAIAALEQFDEGTIAIDELKVSGGCALAGPALRRLRSKVGLVFQFHHLFEHLTALNNVTLAPIHAHQSRQQLRPRLRHDAGRAFPERHRSAALGNGPRIDDGRAQLVRGVEGAGPSRALNARLPKRPAPVEENVKEIAVRGVVLPHDDQHPAIGSDVDPDRLRR